MTCAQCGEHRKVTIGMEPGKDGVPWSLCRRCHGGSPAPDVAPSAPTVGEVAGISRTGTGKAPLRGSRGKG